MRYIVALIFLTALLLQACASTGVDTAESTENEAEEIAYVPQPDLTDKERFRQVLYLLEEGEAVPARAELVLYLQAQPRSEIGQDLLRQIDLPVEDYFPQEYREVELQAGQSLSTLAKNYLGSVYKFHALAKYNSIMEPRKLTAGQVVRIPLTEEAQAAFSSAREANSLAESAETAPEVHTETAVVVPQPDIGEEVVRVEPAVQESAPVDEAAKVEDLHRRALNAYRAQDLDMAIELWDKALAMDPGHENARLYRSQALELKKKLSTLN